MISTNTPNYKIKDLEELIILDYPLLLKTLTESELLETKATIYVNKEQNYAVYNNIEVSLTITGFSASAIIAPSIPSFAVNTLLYIRPNSWERK